MHEKHIFNKKIEFYFKNHNNHFIIKRMMIMSGVTKIYHNPYQVNFWR